MISSLAFLFAVDATVVVAVNKVASVAVVIVAVVAATAACHYCTVFSIRVYLPRVLNHHQPGTGYLQNWLENDGIRSSSFFLFFFFFFFLNNLLKCMHFEFVVFD